MRGARGPRINPHSLYGCRIQAQYTLARLSEVSGVDRSYLSRLERGQRQYPAPEVVDKIADALGVSRVSLLAATEVTEVHA